MVSAFFGVRGLDRALLLPRLDGAFPARRAAPEESGVKPPHSKIKTVPCKMLAAHTAAPNTCRCPCHNVADVYCFSLPLVKGERRHGRRAEGVEPRSTRLVQQVSSSHPVTERSCRYSNAGRTLISHHLRIMQVFPTRRSAVRTTLLFSSIAQISAISVSWPRIASAVIGPPGFAFMIPVSHAIWLEARFPYGMQRRSRRNRFCWMRSGLSCPA